MAIAALMLAVAFLAGRGGLGSGMAVRRDLERALAEARQQLDTQRQLLMNCGVAAEVDRQSLEQVRKTVARLEAELQERRSEVDLYRNLLQDDGGRTGLSVESPHITGGTDAGYAYRIAVRQRGAVLKTVKVVVDVRLLGEMDGVKASFGVAELDPSWGRNPLEASFKYFQVIEGTLTLPPGFRPRHVVVSLRQVGGGNRDETFDWVVENR